MTAPEGRAKSISWPDFDFLREGDSKSSPGWELYDAWKTIQGRDFEGAVFL